MAAIGTTEFIKTRRVEALPFSLIEYKGLLGRLGDEVRQSLKEFLNDPRGFIEALLTEEGKDARRRRRLYAGLLVAAVLHVSFLIVVVVAGWHRFMAPVPNAAERTKVTWVEQPDIPRSSGVTNSQSRPGAIQKGDVDGGGGGGGQKDPRPAIHGAMPQSVPRPPLVAIDSTPAPDPALAVPPTIVGPETAPPPPGTEGDPSSKGTELSGGPGNGGGLGKGKGTGIGPGDGLGHGPGSGVGKGYGIKSGEPNGTEEVVPEVDFRRPPPQGFVPFKWLFRPTPVTTPEAQENKIIGVVLLRATFNSNGVISDVEIVMPVDYMTDSAIESLRRSKFKPATINGKPVTLRKVPIRVAVHY